MMLENFQSTHWASCYATCMAQPIFLLRGSHFALIFYAHALLYYTFALFHGYFLKKYLWDTFRSKIYLQVKCINHFDIAYT